MSSTASLSALRRSDKAHQDQHNARFGSRKESQAKLMNQVLPHLRAFHSVQELNQRAHQRGLAGRRVERVRFAAYATNDDVSTWARCTGKTPSADCSKDMPMKMSVLKSQTPETGLIGHWRCHLNTGNSMTSKSSHLRVPLSKGPFF